jgi:glycosyltransferase involved in cell wall biosynthesis
MAQSKVAICHQSLVWGDAIGHDAVGMYRLLKTFGLAPILVCEAAVNLPADVTATSLNELDVNSVCLLIFHHSQYWAGGERLLAAINCPVILRYHNITPAHFFAPYSPLHMAGCSEGREMTKRLLQLKGRPLWIADSAYNKQDLVESGADPDTIRVVPPFNRIQSLTGYSNHADYDSSVVDFLFVGRCAPNKGHSHLLRVMRAFLDQGDKNARLRIVGEIHPSLAAYHANLADQMAGLGLQANVELIPHSPDAELRNLFRAAHIYLCFSEHEGFCVPVIEAQAVGLPVVASGAAAVGETIGTEQFVAEPPASPADYRFYAALCHRVVRDAELRSELVLQGERNARTRFSAESIENAFAGALYEVLYRQ